MYLFQNIITPWTIIVFVNVLLYTAFLKIVRRYQCIQTCEEFKRVTIGNASVPVWSVGKFMIASDVEHYNAVFLFAGFSKMWFPIRFRGIEDDIKIVSQTKSWVKALITFIQDYTCDHMFTGVYMWLAPLAIWFFYCRYRNLSIARWKFKKILVLHYPFVKYIT